MNPDYAHPIRDNTRDEVFCVPISNCLFQTNVALFQYITSHPEMYPLEKFPHIEEVERNPHRRFQQLCLYSEWEFFEWLQHGDDYQSISHQEFLDKDGESFVKARMSWDPIQYAPRTTFLGAILHLLSIGVIRTLYVYDDIAKYDRAIQALIATTFDLLSQDHFNVQLIQGTAMDVYDSPYYKEATTVILENNDDLHQILMEQSEKDPEGLRQKYFIVPRLKISNFTEESVRLASPKYWILKHYQDYMELEKLHLFNVGYFSLDPFSR